MTEYFEPKFKNSPARPGYGAKVSRLDRGDVCGCRNRATDHRPRHRLQAVHPGLISSMSRADMQRVYRLLKEARERGDIPWEWIVDETRELERVPTFGMIPATTRVVSPNPIAAISGISSPSASCVVSEKGTVRGLLKPVLDHYAVGFLRDAWFQQRHHRPRHFPRRRRSAIDHLCMSATSIPSGMFMSEEDLPNRLASYGGHHVTVRRIALTPEHLSGLSSFPATDKRKDPRYKWFRSNYGDRCWELDAMDPNDLRDCVEREIGS